MDVQQKGILLLIKSAITGERYALPDAFDLSGAIALIRKHKIETMAYYGAINCGYSPQEATMKPLFMICCQQLTASEKQMQEIKNLLEAFEQQGIDALPLKGTILKNLYPKPEMRRMGDADILIREEQYAKIETVLNEAGFCFLRQWNHEIVWDKPTLHLELHRMLIPEHHEHYYSYFRNGWDLAIPIAQYEHIYTMTPEDTLLFLFAHLTKHYTAGGIGLIHMVDLWVYNQACPNLDQDILMDKLKRMGIDHFYENVLRTLQSWFEDAQEDAVTELITQRIFSNGVYGTYDNSVVAKMAKMTRENAGKRPKIVKRLLENIFPSCTILQNNGYPILYKWPVLLPFAWIARWFRLLFVHQNRVRKKVQEFRNTTTEKVDTFEKSLEFVGICFSDKE